MFLSSFDELKNKLVRKVFYNENEITFVLDDDTKVSYRAVGDCCSSSYIEDLDNRDAFTNAIFVDVEEVDGETKDVSDWEVYKWTFYKFKTNKGMCTLSFRNESNGYYNGWLEKVKT